MPLPRRRHDFILWRKTHIKANFVVTELNKAFSLGIAILIPFFVLDLIIANLLVAAGLQSLSPSQVALPLKLMLFMAVDGWGLLAKSLILGYQFS